MTTLSKHPEEEGQGGTRTVVDTFSLQVHCTQFTRIQGSGLTQSVLNGRELSKKKKNKLSIIRHISSKRLLKCFTGSAHRSLHQSAKASTSGMKCNNCSTGHGRGEEVRDTSTSNCNCRGNLGRRNVITPFGDRPDHGG